MNGFNNYIENLAYKNQAELTDGDYLSDEGIIMCGKCHTPKQTRKEFPYKSGSFRLFPIPCKCSEEAEERARQRRRSEEVERHIIQLQNQGLADPRYKNNCLMNDDCRNPRLSDFCRNYIKHWREMKEGSYGILFYGDTGGGKSFYACCIANELIIRWGVPVLVSRLSDLVKNRIDKNSPDIELNKFELIVLDDLGVENATQTVYSIIDDIYRYNIPLIVTTNLAPKQLKASEDTRCKRIYDRVLEMCCIPQLVSVEKSRLDIGKNKKDRALEILRS